MEKKIKNRNKNYNNSNKTMVKKLSVSNIKGIAFYACSEVIRTRNFTVFTVFATNFESITAAFHFSNYIGIDQFTLDLLKRSDT